MPATIDEAEYATELCDEILVSELRERDFVVASPSELSALQLALLSKDVEKIAQTTAEFIYEQTGKLYGI